MIGMNLGIIATAEVDSFQKAAKEGLEFLEFCINVADDVDAFLAKLPKLKEASERTGVAVGSIGRWGPDRIDKNGIIIEEELQRSYQMIDAASFLGCPHFVSGCNYAEEISYYMNCTSAIAYFTKLIEYGKAKGVSISTYNCAWNSFVDNDMAWTLIHGHLSELGIKFDPSHSRYAGRDYLQEMNKWGHRFHHIHIKGSIIIDGKRFDDPPAGLDQTNWGSFMAVLYAKGYKGGLSIEPHSETWSGELGDEGVKFSIDYMQRLLFRK
jgi:sugar phosphate isomerase/epimerase